MKLNTRDLQAIAAGLIAGLLIAATKLGHRDWQFYLFAFIAAVLLLLLVRLNEN